MQFGHDGYHLPTVIGPVPVAKGTYLGLMISESATTEMEATDG